MIKKLIAIAAVIFMVGCAGLGGNVTTPKTDGEKLAYAEATLTGLTIVATKLNDARLIPLDKIKEVERNITKAELVIRLGRVALQGKDSKTVAEHISLAYDILGTLNTFIESKRLELLKAPLWPPKEHNGPRPIQGEVQ